MTGIARGKIAPVDKFLDEKGMRLPKACCYKTVTGDFVNEDVYYSLLDAADIDFVYVIDENAVLCCLDHRSHGAGDPRLLRQNG